MRTLAWGLLVGSLIVWGIGLRRRLRAAQMRGDMYREVAARLDRRAAELGGQER